MLLRYAQHLADGKGIVWNVGEAPVDGATDFLFMVMVAALTRLGMRVEAAALALTLLAHACTVALVYRMHLRWRVGDARSHAWAATLSALVVATGPGLNYCEALFGTTVFALAGLATFAVFLRLLDGEPTFQAVGKFAFLGLLTGLIRPEGVILVGGMLGSLMWMAPAGRRLEILKPFVFLFGLPGMAYFGWHWWYFGHPLPNPFYVKGGGLIYLSSLKASATALLKMGSVLLPLLALGLLPKDGRKKRIALLLPIALFAVVWVLMSNAMNFSFRFQYVLMPILWVAWWPVLVKGADFLVSKFRWIALLLVLGIVGFQGWTYALRPRIHPDGRAALGWALRPWQSQGYTMAITEAGNLPFFSDWKAIDTWGLNDSRIAHAGGVDRKRFETERPVLVMIHDYYSPGRPKLRPEEKWALMTDSLLTYMPTDQYELVACWGRTSESTHFYYLRRDIPDFVALKQLITGFAYDWYEDGLPAQNFLGKGE